MKNSIPVLLLILIGILFLEVVVELPPFGAIDNPAHNYVYQRYTREGREDTGSYNIVNAIIFDYRAYDTLGEATVLFTSIAAVILAMRSIVRRRSDE